MTTLTANPNCVSTITSARRARQEAGSPHPAFLIPASVIQTIVCDGSRIRLLFQGGIDAGRYDQYRSVRTLRAHHASERGVPFGRRGGKMLEQLPQRCAARPGFERILPRRDRPGRSIKAIALCAKTLYRRYRVFQLSPGRASPVSASVCRSRRACSRAGRCGWRRTRDRWSGRRTCSSNRTSGECRTSLRGRLSRPRG